MPVPVPVTRSGTAADASARLAEAAARPATGESRVAGSASAGCHHAEPGDPADADAVAALAGGEADVCLAAERSLDDDGSDQGGQPRSS